VSQVDSPLLKSLLEGGRGEVVRVGAAALRAEDLLAASAALQGDLAACRRVAVLMTPALEAVVGLVAGLLAGVEVVPLNPAAGPLELNHVLTDSRPELVLHAPGVSLSDSLAAVPGRVVKASERAVHQPPDLDPGSVALILYTSGTTGPPKGVMLSRRAIASNLDALARAWGWTAADTVLHALPLYHAHGLVLATLGPLHLGGRSHHLGRLTPAALVDGFASGGTMLFAVPTMYHRLAAEAATDKALAGALRGARLLVSGSAPLAAADYRRIRDLTGQRIVERYGLTESLMCTAARADGPRQPGTVGPPLAGVEVRLLDEQGRAIPAGGAEDMGEIAVRGPALFEGYLNAPDATAAALRDGWLMTGDIGTRDPDGSIRLVGRRSTDLVKTGGYRVGAGEVEAALEDHPAVAEAAVLGEADEDLGQRIAAWVVLVPGAAASAGELAEHVSARLAPHKRPRRVYFVAALPRNALGKVLKRQLAAPPATEA
jgi:malonyl-CoA/methylmalonyl-CoA synthetase